MASRPFKKASLVFVEVLVVLADCAQSAVRPPNGAIMAHCAFHVNVVFVDPSPPLSAMIKAHVQFVQFGLCGLANSVKDTDVYQAQARRRRGELVSG